MTYFECYSDELLLRNLGFTAKELSGGHSFGRAKVCYRLSKSNDSVALIDEDPGSSMDPYLSQVSKTVPIFTDNYLICWKDKKNNNLLVVLRPDLETWIIRLAKDVDIDLTEYRLSNDSEKLYDLLMLSSKRETFKKLLQDLSKHKIILKLKEVLKK